MCIEDENEMNSLICTRSEILCMELNRVTMSSLYASDFVIVETCIFQSFPTVGSCRFSD